MARILTLTNWYPPHHIGGYEVLCADVTSGLAARGHQVEVVCSDEIVPGAELPPDDGSSVHRRLRMYWKDGAPWTPPFRTQLEIERSNQRELASVLERYQPDVVSVWHMGALSLSLLSTIARRGIPMVYAICDEWLIYGLELDPWAGRWYRNPIRRMAGRVVEKATGLPAVVPNLGATGCVCFLSDFTRESSRTASPWSFPTAPVIYPGISLERYPLSAATTSSEWSWKLLYMGRLDARKGTDTLLRAMPLLPPHATVAFLGRGEPSEKARLEHLALELGINGRVRFETVDAPQIPGEYRSHDCLVFPSEWPEPFGLVPIEAMACGTPVVGTGVGGSGEYLIDGFNCLIVKAGDESALADAVTRLAADNELRHTLRLGGLDTAAKFDIEGTITAYERCHMATVEGRLHELSLAEHPWVQAHSSPSSRQDRSDVVPLRTRTRLKNRWRGWYRPRDQDAACQVGDGTVVRLEEV